MRVHVRRLYAFMDWRGTTAHLRTTAISTTFRNGLYCWRFHHSIRHWLGDLTPFFPVLFLKCSSLLLYSAIRIQADRCSKSGLVCSSELLFRVSRVRFPGFFSVVVSKKIGFIFIVVVLSTPGKYLCVVFVWSFPSQVYKRESVFLLAVITLVIRVFLVFIFLCIINYFLFNFRYYLRSALALPVRFRSLFV